ncbi:MOSC domain-containing protein [Nocardioides sp. ChNu-153]|uniref:MOSC domain-containing protein n=1 Tax=Nocardioides sp. ChNu-153 TaxID=2779364 RepID=UPI0026591B84|nr:MOSC domain-containing protein [Nocardioides sp. ChNu-153]
MPSPTATVVALHLAPAHRTPMRAMDALELVGGRGIVGDRFFGARSRHVTVQTAEDLAVATGRLGRPVTPDRTRRNITLDRGPLPTTPGARLRLAGLDLEVLRVAAPCRIMEDELGPGGAVALRRRGGVVCRLLDSGTVRIGDVCDLDPPRDDQLF